MTRLCPNRQRLKYITYVLFVPKLIENSQSLPDIIIILFIRIWLVMLFSTSHMYEKWKLISIAGIAGAIQLAYGNPLVALFFFSLALFSSQVKMFHKTTLVPRLDKARRFS